MCQRTHKTQQYEVSIVDSLFAFSSFIPSSQAILYEALCAFKQSIAEAYMLHNGTIDKQSRVSYKRARLGLSSDSASYVRVFH